MRSQRLLRVAAGLLLIILPGCVTSHSDPVFPDDQVPTMIDASDFDRISSHLDGYEGSLLKLAGRIVDANPTKEGAVILATWLPYPPHFELEDGPPDISADHSRHFAVLFPGLVGDPFERGPDYDPLIAWEGNKFVLEAKLKGSRKMLIDVLDDREQSLPFFVTRCIHVWETGESEPEDQPDSQWPGQVARTFCARSGS